MITGLKKNKFTQTLATGAAALGVLAGVGLAMSKPAQAGGVFSLQTFNGTTPVANCTSATLGCVTDTESGSPGELIWTTFPGFPTSTAAGEGNEHGTPGVNGYDNPMITFTPDLLKPNGYFLIEYFGSGTAAQTNNFLWDKGDGNGFVSLFGPQSGPGTGPNGNCANVFGTPCAFATVPLVNGKLPFQFVAGTTPITNIPNGTPYVDPPGAPHYFATIDGTWATTSNPVPQFGNMVYLGLSDRVANDDDASDYVVKITYVPEPLTLGGVALAAAFGAAFKRKLNKSDREKN